ncbi:E3 ubiquitin/ISG15 ligase TRIM25-like [Rhinophrynus dorsalis]
MALNDPGEEQSCSLCLRTFGDPIMLGCGHNFCQDCIGWLLDTHNVAGVYNCPECQTEFQELPVLPSSLNFENTLEHFFATHEQKLPDFACSYCLDSFVRAVKMCVHCDAFLCETHLTHHSKSEEHVLINPSTSLEKRKCSIHTENLKYICSEDETYLCISCCVAGEHKGHKVELLKDVADKKKEKLKHILQKLNLEREHTNRRVQSLQDKRQVMQEKVVAATDKVSARFRELRHQLDVLEKQVQSEIIQQIEQISSHVYNEIQELEIKKEELSRKILFLEELCAISDPIATLQRCESVSVDVCDVGGGKTEKLAKDDEKVSSVDELEDVLISLTLQRSLTNLLTDLRARQTFSVKADTDISLDLDTAANNVVVSDDLKTASCTRINQFHPNTPERFWFCQVFSMQHFISGQHYWEVETSESGYWKVGMAYASLERIGRQCHIGQNKSSWCLHVC